MKTMSRLILSSLAIAAVLGVTGCQTVSVHSTEDTGAADYPASDPEKVQILRTEPTRPHERLGEVRAEPSDESVSAEKIEKALRKAAAKLGADAVVVVSDRTQVTGAYVTGPWYGRSIEQIDDRIVIAVAIKYQ